MRLIRLAAALAATVVATTAAGAAPAVITNPDWLERPDGEAVAQHYPKLAARLEIEGRATLSCVVNAEGRLYDCTPLAESPADLGFGDAAVAMSKTFRMKPQTLNGQPVDGGTVRIPLRFTLPQDDEPATEPPAAPSEAAQRQAERLVDASGAVPRSEAETLRVARQEAQGLPPETVAAAEKALQQAYAAHRAELRTAYARAFASVFTLEELSAIADYVAGPGKAFDEEPTLAATSELIGRDVWRRMREPGRAAFCARRACPTPAGLEAVWKPAPAGDNRLDAPQWMWAPNPNAVLAVTPSLPAALGLTGAVRMTCKVAREGALSDCKVDEQLPAGLGYGSAALALADHYRLSPIHLDAGALGRKVTVRLGFPPPPLGEAYKPLKGRSERAVDLARQLSVEDDAARLAQRDIEVQIVSYETRRPADSDKTAWDAAIAAYRSGAQAAVQQGIEYHINAVASVMTEEQLVRLVAFRTSPAGRARRDMQDSLEPVIENAGKFVGNRITAAANAAFCKTRPCVSTAPQPTAASDAPSTRNP